MVVNVDIRQAFDSVRISDVNEIHRQQIADQPLGELIEILLRGAANNRRGIAQGIAYSPTALNVLLHFHLDQLFGQDGNATPWRRYADNLIYVCHDIPEGREALQRTVRLLLDVGLELKEPRDVTDLTDKGQSTDLLGYRLELTDKGLQFGIPPTSWDSLHHALLDCHNMGFPRERAAEVLQGWIEYQAPSFGEAAVAISQQLTQLANLAGVDPISQRPLIDIIERAKARWERFRIGKRVKLPVVEAAPQACIFFGLDGVQPGVAGFHAGDLGAPF